MNIENIKKEFDKLKSNERHNTNAESRYWCEQYKNAMERLIQQLAQQPSVDVLVDALQYFVNSSGAEPSLSVAYIKAEEALSYYAIADKAIKDVK